MQHIYGWRTGGGVLPLLITIWIQCFTTCLGPRRESPKCPKPGNSLVDKSFPGALVPVTSKKEIQSVTMFMLIFLMYWVCNPQKHKGSTVLKNFLNPFFYVEFIILCHFVLILGIYNLAVILKSVMQLVFFSIIL